ncbi:MAG: phospholipase D family protein [Halobacteriota archaeon]
MKINPAIERLVRRFVVSYLLEHTEATLTELIDAYPGPVYINEAEFRNAVQNAVEEGYLGKVGNTGAPISSTRICLLKPFPVPEKENFTLVISRPRLQEIGLLSLQLRNEHLDSADCFRTIIESSNHTLRICSPFLQSNVLDADTFPDLAKLLENAFNRGVNIFLLSRELFYHRGPELHWIIDLAKSLDKEDKLKIVDYHLPDSSGRIISSTHAKLLISDTKLAYVGSAELRRNSLLANFEVGCLVSGPEVVGICEIFDAMFTAGRVWYAR